MSLILSSLWLLLIQLKSLFKTKQMLLSGNIFGKKKKKSHIKNKNVIIHHKKDLTYSKKKNLS